MLRIQSRILQRRKYDAANLHVCSNNNNGATNLRIEVRSVY